MDQVIPDGAATAPPGPIGDVSQVAAPAAPPIQQAAPVYTPPPTPTPSFFSGINVGDVLVGAIVFGAMFTIIYYYRKEIKYSKTEKSEIRQQLDEVSQNVQAALGPNYQKY